MTCEVCCVELVPICGIWGIKKPPFHLYCLRCWGPMLINTGLRPVPYTVLFPGMEFLDE